jgi:hypothetical protein
MLINSSGLKAAILFTPCVHAHVISRSVGIYNIYVRKSSVQSLEVLTFRASFWQQKASQNSRASYNRRSLWNVSGDRATRISFYRGHAYFYTQL